MKVRAALLLMLVGAVVGVGVTLLLRDGDGGQVSRIHSRATAGLNRKLAELRARLAERDHRAKDHAAEGGVGGAPDGAKRTQEQSTEQRRRELEAKVLKARAQIDGMFTRGEGAAVLALLDRLVAMGPVAWPLATELWVRIEADLWSGSKLGYSKWIEIAGHLESPAMTEVFNWSLTHDAPERFREGAVYRLPWVQDLKKTLSQFERLLKTTDEPCVVVALVRGLRKLESGDARAMLLQAVSDQRRKPATRATIAVHLAYQGSAWAKPVLEEIARTDPDAGVRTAATVALIAFDPPATGVLVAAIKPGAAGSGLRAGDVILRYGERRTTQRMHLGQEIYRREAEVDPIEVELVRDGRRLKLYVPTGELGLITREVRAKE